MSDLRKFIITTTATATIEETWSIMAVDEDAARDAFDNEGDPTMKHISDRTIGGEEDREIMSVEEEA